MIHILFFGKLADIAEQSIGSSEIQYELSAEKSDIVLTDLRKIIAKKAPALSAELNKASNLCAVNQELCHNITETIIKNGDEVAFMSPLSGG